MWYDPVADKLFAQPTVLQGVGGSLVQLYVSGGVCRGGRADGFECGEHGRPVEGAVHDGGGEVI